MAYAFFVLAAIVIAYLVWRQRQNPPAAFQGPVSAPEPERAGPDRGMSDPVLRRLYLLLHEITQVSPEVTRPEHLATLPGYRDAVQLLADPDVSNDLLFGLVQGERLYPAIAALDAFTRRTPDAGIEAQLWAQLNRFHPWNGDGVLRVLEAWHSEDPTLAGRVLLRLDRQWAGSGHAVSLERFLRRRAAVAPLTLEGIEPPTPSRAEELLELVLPEQDDQLVAPFVSALRAIVGPPTAMGPRPGGMPDPEAASDLKGIGQWHERGKMPEPAVYTSPSLDECFDGIVKALTAQPPRPVLVVGESGVGKTALARRVASHLSRGGWRVYEAGASQLNAGMSFVGMLERRLLELRKRLAAEPKTLWLVPDFHQLLWSGRAMQSPTGALEQLMPAFESGEILALGETRPGTLDRLLAERPEIGRLFEIVRLAPPRDREVTELLTGWAERVARERRVTVEPWLLDEAAQLSRQYLSSLRAPGGVLRMLELAVTAVAPPDPESPAVALQHEDVLKAVSTLTGLPGDLLDERRPLDLDALRARLEERVIGQADAVAALVERVALLKAGVTDPKRPYGVFLFAGPTGTGKTELAKALANWLFGSEDRLLRLDMSELSDGFGLERVTGAATNAGAGSLAAAIRRQPFSVVLLDEFEKAHPRVWNLFLSVFDDGRLTDAAGETADFRNSIIILTSNLGATLASGERLGFAEGGNGFSATAVERSVARAFAPELRNRLDRIVVFRPFTRDVMRRILHKEIADASARRGLRRREWAVEIEESAIDFLLDHGFTTDLGARPLKRSLERYLLAPLARTIVERRVPEGDQFLFVRTDGDALAVEFVDPDAPPVIASVATTAMRGPDLRAIAWDAHGTAAEMHELRGALERFIARIEGAAWRDAKAAWLALPASEGFWQRSDRFELLGRAEYMDRIEAGSRSARSLMARLDGDGAAQRAVWPRNMVARLAQQMLLLEAAAEEAMATGPRDAFIYVQAGPDGPDVSEEHEFARRIAAMYESWARQRGMRIAVLKPTTRHPGDTVWLAVSGFSSLVSLVPENGLHVLEWGSNAEGGVKRASVRVRVLAQPLVPARDGEAELTRQAAEVLAAAPVPPPTIVRRYRGTPSPLVRDSVRGWRTGRLERVFAGDFDLVPAGENEERRNMSYLLRKLLSQPDHMLQNLVVRLRTATSWDRLYAKLPEPKRVGAVVVDDAAAAAVRAAVEADGLTIDRRSVEPERYRKWLARADYARHPLYMDGGRAAGFHEKGLEHFLAVELVGLSAGQRCIDVASQHSPAPEIYARLHGAEVYTQDLAYPDGVNGRRIGGSASQLPLPDGFADAMVLHNAFEHFEGDSDIGFIREAARVLKPGGRLCIVPLFLYTEYAIQTDPAALTNAWPPFDAGARLWCARGWRDRHGRFYDVQHLRSRLLANAEAFDVRLIEYADARVVSDDCYLRFAVVFTRR